MRRAGARAPWRGGAAALVASAFMLAACSNPAPRDVATSAGSLSSIEVPLDATFATEFGEEAVVPMGRLNDRLETFWQLFFRPTATSRWTLVTPKGVADNGGLVVSTSTGAGADAGAGAGSATAAATAATATTTTTTTVSLAGFEPSQYLDFSPLASSTDQGETWSPGLLPGGLAAVPDALSASSDAGLVALARGGGGHVLTSSGDPSRWTKLVSRDAIASSAAGRSCGVGALSAVALDTAEGVEVGTSCSAAGLVGIFGKAGGTWHLVGPRVSSPSERAATQVLRLVDVNGLRSVLVALHSKARTSLVALASNGGGAWTRSVALPVDTGDRIASTGVEPGGGFVVLLSRSNGSLALHAENGPGADWRSLPSPPPGTATVAVSAGGQVDALAVATTKLTDWRLSAPARTWSRIGTVTVPIQFGSSS